MFKVGDMVYVAFAVGWKFETHLTTVKDVVEKDGEVKYIVECYCDAARFSNDMFEHYDDSRKENEIFEATKEGKAKCDKEVASMKILVLYFAALTVAIVRIWDVRTQQIQDL